MEAVVGEQRPDVAVESEWDLGAEGGGCEVDDDPELQEGGDERVGQAFHRIDAVHPTEGRGVRLKGE